MSSGVLYRPLQPPTSVTAACCVQCSPSHVVVQLQDTQLTCWRAANGVLEQTASWRAPASMLQMVHLPNNYLLVMAEGGSIYMHRLQDQPAAATAPSLAAHDQLSVPIDTSCSQVAPFGCVVSSNVLTAATGNKTACLVATAYLPGVLHVIKATTAGSRGATSSEQLQTKAMLLTHVLLSCHYPGGAPPGLASVRVHSRVLGLTWLSPREQQLDPEGRALLAVLHEFSAGGAPPVLHVDCVAVNWLDGSITPGPWSLRNVHPTTRLLLPFSGSAELSPGVLLVSSRGVQLCTCLGNTPSQPQLQQASSSSQTGAPSSSAGWQAAAAAAEDGPGLLGPGLCVHQQELVQWVLSGLPLSCAALTDSCFLVGDNRAELYLLQLPQSGSDQGTWLRLPTTGCLSIPDVLLPVPLAQQQHSQQEHDAAEEQQQLAALLLVGSRCSSSQTLGIPQSLWDAITSNRLDALQQQDHQQAPWVLPVVQSALLPSIAGAQSVAVYKDPSGALPEQQLLVACGTAPRGKLAVVRSGCGLLPVMLDGPELPGDAVLFPIPQPAACLHKQAPQPQGLAATRPHHQQQRQPPHPQTHSMLGFSFPSVGSSTVMSLEGSTFRELQLPGLSQQEPSLLMTTAPGGWLLQVTASAVRVLGGAAAGGDWQLASTWTPPGGPVSLASACGSQLVLACGSSLTCLAVDCCSGSLALTATAELQQQASALAVFKLQGGQSVVAAGLWVDNSITLLTADGPTGSSLNTSAQQQQQAVDTLQAKCSVSLGPEQPRSIALLPVGDCDVLLVGSNTGKVLMWDVVCNSSTQQQHASPQQEQQQEALALQHGRAVQVGNISVSLQLAWMPKEQLEPSQGISIIRSSSSSSSCSDDDAWVVPCVVAQAGAIAVFRPHLALLAAAQQACSPPAAPAPDPSAAAPTRHASASACVEVSRLCGSESCLAAAPLHTPSMPFSMAWVSNTHQLCFGSMAGEHKLRWRSVGLPGTPLAVAVHKQSDTIVLLLAADEYESGPSSSRSTQPSVQQQYAQQRLVVADATSLRVLLVLALAPAHTYTSLQVLHLPATSQQQQQPSASLRGPWQTRVPAAAVAASSSADPSQQQPQQQHDEPGSATQQGCLPLIVLGSQAVLATAGTAANSRRPAGAQQDSSSPPHVKRIGVLSFFELRTKLVHAAAAAGSTPGQQTAAGAGGAELQFELVLHGMVPLNSTPASLCTVVPHMLPHSWEEQLAKLDGTQQQDVLDAAVGTRVFQAALADTEAGAAAASGWLLPAAEPPLLAVGSEWGVTLLRVLLDDAAVSDRQQQEELLTRAGKVPDSFSNPAAAAAAAEAPDPHAHAHADEPGAAMRCGRVWVQEFSTDASSSQGLVTKVSSSGSCLVAQDALGSLSVLCAMCAKAGGWVQLLPVSMVVDDWPRLAVADFAIEPHHVAAAVNKPTPQAAAAVAAAGAAAGTTAAGTAHLHQHQAILAAVQPAGVMVLRRDGLQELRHLAVLLTSARRQWDLGRRVTHPGCRPGLRPGSALLMQRVLLGPDGQPDIGATVQHWEQQQHQQLQAPGQHAGGAQQGLMPPVAPDWLPCCPEGTALAHVLTSSASCGPAPGSTLLCQAQLGLRTVSLAGQDSWHSSREHFNSPGSSSSSGGGGQQCLGSSDKQPQLLRWLCGREQLAAGSAVFCFSASGAVSVAQLLPPEATKSLVDWQHFVELVFEPSTLAPEFLRWDQRPSGDNDSDEQSREADSDEFADGSSSSCTAARAVKELSRLTLRGLQVPGEVASHTGHAFTPGAVRGSLATRGRGRLPVACEEEEEQPPWERRATGAVDGGLMFAGADITAAMPAADGTARPSVDAAELQATNTHALVLQHCLWQHAL